MAYGLPAYGETGWHTKLNDSMAAVKATADAALPATSFLQAETPQKHGAVGDGVADDTAAVQAAINAAEGVAGAVVLLRGTYRITSTLTVSAALNMRGAGQGDSIVGDAAVPVVLDVAPASSGTRLHLSGFKVTLASPGAGIAVRLSNVVAVVRDLECAGGTALHLGTNVYESFFDGIQLTGSTYGIVHETDTSGENSFNKVRIYGSGSGVLAGYKAISTAGGDIGGQYLNDVVVALATATTAGSTAKGFWFAGPATGPRANHPFFMHQCVADNMTVPVRIENWGSITWVSSWTFSAGADVFQIANSSADIAIFNGRQKGGTNFIRFEGAFSTHISHGGNRIPDATNLYAIDADAPSVLTLGAEDTTATISAAARSAIVGAMAGQKPYIQPSRLITHSSNGSGAIEFVNETGNARSLRLNGSGEIEWLNEAFSEVDLALRADGGAVVRGPVRVGRADTSFLPSATTTGNGSLYYDSLAKTLLVSDGADWMNGTVHSVGGVGEPAFLNSWVNYGAPFGAATFSKTADGRVHLSGIIKNGTGATAAFVLPVGFRPAAQVTVTVTVNTPGTVTTLDILPTGEVQPYVTGGFVSLDGISFRAG